MTAPPTPTRPDRNAAVKPDRTRNKARGAVNSIDADDGPSAYTPASTHDDRPDARSRTHSASRPLSRARSPDAHRRSRLADRAAGVGGWPAAADLDPHGQRPLGIGS